jgi:hypothetical protein
VKRHKTFFGFGFKSFFLDWLYFYFGFGFWLSVRNGFLYFVFGFSFFIYFILYWLPPLFIRSSPLASPFFIWSVKTNYIFICHPFATATAAATATTAPAPAPLALDPR